jgi:hypothetical protein
MGLCTQMCRVSNAFVSTRKLRVGRLRLRRLPAAARPAGFHPALAKHPAAWDVLQLVWCSTVDAAACRIDAISSMLAGRQVLCSSGLGSLQQPAAGRAHFGVQRQQELRKRRCASCRAQYDAGWASSSLDAQVMLHNLRLAADCKCGW